MSTFEQIQGRKKKAKEEGIWLFSFCDLTTNLMALFIMLLSMSKIDTNKFDAVSKVVTRQKTDNLDELKVKLDAEITNRNLQSRVRTDLGEFGLNVEFLSGGLFESASAELTPKSLADLKPLLQILSKTDPKYLLSFEGHTDDVPLKKGRRFSDNWALSSARGVALLNRMAEMGVPTRRMSVAGHAETRPKVSIEGKKGQELELARAANRRVVIRVYQ